MATHTPGPWRHEGDRIYADGGGRWLYDITPGMGLDADDPAEDEANARLIAAAPELLAALKDILADLEHGDPAADLTADMADTARAALADRLDAAYGVVVDWADAERLTGYRPLPLKRRLNARLAQLLPGSTYRDQMEYLSTHLVTLDFGVRLTFSMPKRGTYCVRAKLPEGVA
jgi:hypothetical protein